MSTIVLFGLSEEKWIGEWSKFCFSLRFQNFLSSFINQVDFLSKNKLLLLFYKDGSVWSIFLVSKSKSNVRFWLFFVFASFRLFLSTCEDSELRQILQKHFSVDWKLIGLRLKQLEVNFHNENTKTRVNSPQCSVQAVVSKSSTNVDIFQYKNDCLFSRLAQFVCDTMTRNIGRMKFVSDWDFSRVVFVSANVFQNYFGEFFFDLIWRHLFSPLG